MVKGDVIGVGFVFSLAELLDVQIDDAVRFFTLETGFHSELFWIGSKMMLHAHVVHTVVGCG